MRTLPNPPPSLTAYRAAFGRWDELSWIRNKPRRREGLDGLPFPKELTPLTSHHRLKHHPEITQALLAYRLLAHLKFTTTLELDFVNPACALIAQSATPVGLTFEQREDALKIYCDEGGHALFVEALAERVASRFGVNARLLGQPAFGRKLAELSAGRSAGIQTLLKLCFVSVSETLITGVLKDIPNDPAVAPAVRAVIGDHANDELRHAVYFRWYFPQLWMRLTEAEREELAPLLPQLLGAFLDPDRELELAVLLGMGVPGARDIVEESHGSTDELCAIRKAAEPTLRLFEGAGVFEEAAAREAFAERGWAP